MRGTPWATVWAGVSVVLAAACIEREEAPTAAQLAPRELPAGITPAVLAEGRRVYLDEGNCFACHGKDAEGTVFGPDLTDAEWMHVGGTYEEIVRVVARGIPHTEEYPAPMPAMGGARLDEAEVRAVAAYVYALGQPRSGARASPGESPPLLSPGRPARRQPARRASGACRSSSRSSPSAVAATKPSSASTPRSAGGSAPSASPARTSSSAMSRTGRRTGRSASVAPST